MHLLKEISNIWNANILVQDLNSVYRVISNNDEYYTQNTFFG